MPISCQPKYLQRALTRELCWHTHLWQLCSTGWIHNHCCTSELTRQPEYQRAQLDCTGSKQQRQPGTRRKRSTGTKLRSRKRRLPSCSLSMKSCRCPQLPTAIVNAAHPCKHAHTACMLSICIHSPDIDHVKILHAYSLCCG